MNSPTHRFARYAAGALIAAAAVAAVAGKSFAVPSYDGLWSVSIVTDRGSCDRGYRYPIRISGGVLANAGSVAFTITGHVQPTGAITVTVAHGGSSATGTGRLAGSNGSGHWAGGDCSGTWSAERRGA